LALPRRRSDRADFGRLRAFLTLLDREFYPLAFIQVAETLSLDLGIVYEDILAVFTFNETVAFATIEPLHGTLLFIRHDLELLSKILLAKTWVPNQKMILYLQNGC